MSDEETWNGRPRPRRRRRDGIVPPERRQRAESTPETKEKWAHTNKYPQSTRHSISDRYEALLDGRLTVDDLDDEEILRGRLKASDGTFRGPNPKLIPYALHKALQASFTERMERLLMASAPQMIDRLIQIANTPGMNAEARVKASIWVLERAIGKAPTKVEVESTVTARWEQGMSTGALVVEYDEQGGAGVQDGQPASGPTPAITTGDEDVVDAVIVETDENGQEILPEPEAVPERETFGAITDTTPAAIEEIGEPMVAPAKPKPRRKSTGIQI